MPSSPDFGIPFVAESQSQANVTHNEAVVALQVMSSGVDDRGSNSAPGSPANGDAQIVGSAPTGAWAGKANKIAYYLSGWRFIPGNDNDDVDIPIGAAHEGLRVYVRDENRVYLWTGAAWQAQPFPDTYATVATDADFTLTPGTSAKRTRHTGTLTNDRTITLSTTGAVAGDTWIVSRTGPGAFNLSVGGLKNLATNEWCEVTFDGSAWYLSQFGAL